MKNLFVVIAILISFQLSAFSPISYGAFKDSTQKPREFGADFLSLEEGSIFFSAGYGALNYFNGVIDEIDIVLSDNTKGLGPIHLKAELMLRKTLGMALVMNHVETHGSMVYDDGFGQTYSVSLNHRSTSFIWRLNWHFYNENGLDLFLGGGLGYRYGSLHFSTSYNHFQAPILTFVNFPIGFEFSGGFRYFITNHFGLYAEFGLTKSIMQAGLTYKL